MRCLRSSCGRLVRNPGTRCRHLLRTGFADIIVLLVLIWCTLTSIQSVLRQFLFICAALHSTYTEVQDIDDPFSTQIQMVAAYAQANAEFMREMEVSLNFKLSVVCLGLLTNVHNDGW